MMNIRVSGVMALGAAVAMLLPAQAFAGTRAQSSKSYTITYTAPPPVAAASSSRGNDASGKGHLGKDNDDRDDRGPKDGFPHNHGHGHDHDHDDDHGHHGHNQSNGC